jgi:phosphoribosylamine--glycine ligase
MRFLGVTETCDLASLYLRLIAEGHEVKLAISDPLAQGTMAGLVQKVEDWRSELAWVRAAGADGVILFESVSKGFGALQDALRKGGYHVIGGSAHGDRLENDRAYAQQLLGGLGFPTGHVWEFSDPAAAEAFISDQPRRYVLKLSGPDHDSSDNHVGQMEDGRDVRAILRARAAYLAETCAKLILMEHIDGIEMGVGAYFDGEDFLMPACLDWEHKRFFAGDLGELTGEMGTVATFDRTQRFFDLTLAKMAPLLRDRGHVGYINLNTIVNAEGIWPLEFTCRFGYPGFAVLDPLQALGWGDLFQFMITGSGRSFPTRAGFSVGVLMTTPPFPYTRKQIDGPVGLPVVFEGSLTAEDLDNIHYGEIGLAGGELVTSGLYGWTLVVTGLGPTIAAARDAAYDRIGKITIPNTRYRLDIGDKLITGDYRRLEALGLLDEI